MEKRRTPFGARMRQARLDAGLTQVVAAKRAQIAQSTLAEIENDAHSSGYTPVLAEIYGADAHYLATGKARKVRGASQWATRVAGWVDEFPEALRQQAAWRCRGALDGFRVELEEAPAPKKERVRSRS